MTPKLNVSKTLISPKANSAVVLAVAEKNGKVQVLSDSPISELSKLDLALLGAKATKETFIRIPASTGGIFLLIGTGEAKPSRAVLRPVAGAAIRALPDVRDIALALPATNKSEALAIVEGAALASYEFTKYKASKTKQKLASVTLVTDQKISAADLQSVVAVGQAVSATKDLVNTAPNDLYPQSMAAAFQKAAKGLAGVTVTVWSEKELKANKMVGMLAVGQGSTRGPRLVKIEYKPKTAKKHVAFVGKGITFDSGGLSLKPAAGMLGMKYDMTGAATVGHAVLAIAALKLPIRATAYLCIAENLPSGAASRPNDVITYKNGKSVEITNTDAEGRLVLADGLILASATKPDLIVDVATLTGAARIALGVRYTGLMGNDQGIETIKKAAALSDELVWHMPLPEELRSNLNSDVADLVNSKVGDPSGGMLVGGLFLNEFVGFSDKEGKKQIPWAHLDIAGPANNDGAPYGFLGKGATGVMLRTLVETARNLA